jgi:urea transporter
MRFIIDRHFLAHEINPDARFHLLETIFKSFSQIMFQNNVLSGFLILLGIALRSKRTAILALIAVGIATIFAMLLSQPHNEINVGLYGFNAVLCAAALTGKLRKSLIPVCVASVISAWIFVFMHDQGIIALTAPFVIATWLTIGGQRLIRSR